jgi:hypothetical protein
MADMAWYGEAVFPDVESRDRAEGLIDDFMEATVNTIPYGEMPGYPSGCERVTQLHIDESDGPGLRWCHRMPEDMGTQAAPILEAIDGLALTYNAGTAPLA